VKVTKETELQTGFGDPLDRKLIELEARPGDGSDIESGLGCGHVHQLRMALQSSGRWITQKILDYGKWRRTCRGPAA